jgi:peroxiredoxin
LGQLQEIEPQLKEMGYQLIAISPDKPADLVKIRKNKKLSYLLLSDSKMAASRALGIAFVQDTQGSTMNKGMKIVIEKASGEKHHQLPVPSVFIVGTDGVIDFMHFNPDYKVRIEPDILLDEAKKAAEK